MFHELDDWYQRHSQSRPLFTLGIPTPKCRILNLGNSSKQQGLKVLREYDCCLWRCNVTAFFFCFQKPTASNLKCCCISRKNEGTQHGNQTATVSCRMQFKSKYIHLRKYLPRFPFDFTWLWWWVPTFIQVKLFGEHLVFKIWILIKTL